MGSHVTYDHPGEAAALRVQLTQRGFQYRSDPSGEGLSTDAPPDVVEGIIRILEGRGGKPGISKAAWEKWPWFVNFTQGHNPPRRYSVPVPSLKVAEHWEHKYKEFGDRRYITISQKPARGAKILPPNMTAY